MLNQTQKIRESENNTVEEYIRPKVYSVKEVATLLKVGPPRVYDLIDSGALKVIKLGYIKVPAEELDKFISKYTGKDLSDPNHIVDYLAGENNDTEDHREIS